MDGGGDGGEGEDRSDSFRTVRTGSGAIVTASPALRSIISNKSSCGKNFEQEAGKGGAFTSYTPEEKVGGVLWSVLEWVLVVRRFEVVMLLLDGPDPLRSTATLL